MVILNLKKRAITKRIRNDPYYRFQSLTEIEIAAQLGIKIDVNQASIDDWLRLPGISIHQAKVLVELVRRGVHLVCLEDIAAIVNLPVARLLPLEPILQFAYYDRVSVLSPQKINLNQASLEEIRQLPLLNEALANLVISEREAKGKYLNFADLQARLKLDNELLSQLVYSAQL